MGGLKNSTFLVSGGTGFIGGHLVEELVRANQKVVVPYIVIESKSYFASKNLSQKIILEKVDVRNSKAVSNLVEKFSIEYIIHLAAQTLVTKAFENPSETLETNIMGTVSILEAARLNNKIRGVIVASSDKAYGKTKKTYTEESRLAGDHPYEVSKSSADLIAQTYFKTYGVPIVVTRFGNVYGQGDLHFDRIIPGICNSVITNQELLLRSDGTFVRDYIYVKDVVSGYILLLENISKTAGEAYNFSSQDTFSVLELIRKIEKINNKKIPYKIKNTAVNEIPYQHLNDDKIRRLGWKNLYSLDTVFPQVLRWYENIL